MSDINGIPDEEEMTEEVSGEQEIRPEFKGEYPEEFFTNPVVVNSSDDTSHSITVAGQTLSVPIHHLQPKAIGESQLQELNTERYADQDWHNQQANRQKKHMIHTEDGKKHGPFSSKENAEKFASSRKDLKSPKYVAEEETMEKNKLQESEALSLKEAFNDKLGSMTEFKVSLGEEVKGIFESQQLDEEVGNQLISVFESVVTSAAKAHLEQINESAADLFSDLVNAKFTQMDEEVSDYLESVVNEWFEENKPAVIESQRVVAVESFVKNLSEVLQSAGLMAECGVDKEKMKEEKVEESQEDQTSMIASLQEELVEYKKKEVLESVCKNMSMVKVEKIRALSEALDFHSVEDYTRKMEIIAESVSGKQEDQAPVVEQESEITTEEVVVEEKKDGKTPVVEQEDEIAYLARVMKVYNRF